METRTCDNCERCHVLGWRPGRDVHTISYWCAAKSEHVSHWEACGFYIPGDPWERVRKEERRAEALENVAEAALGGVRVLVLCKDYQESDEAFQEFLELMEKRGVAFKARAYDRRVSLECGGFAQFDVKLAKRAKARLVGFQGEVVKL